MIDAEDDIPAILTRAAATASQAKSIAMQHITAYAPFTGMIDFDGNRTIPDFDRVAALGIVQRAELEELLERDIDKYLALLHALNIQYPQLGAVRLAVLVHVAMVITYSALKGCRDLWYSISNNRWDDAHDALLMTKWPDMARTDNERRKVLEMARMMRTGLAPIDWITRTH